jgi:DNA invertase Pin-like site-specific DNA recombinase
MLNVIYYCRVSTDEQAEKGTSLGSQHDRFNQFTLIQNFNAVKTFEEDFSAKYFDDRPEFNKLLSFLKANKGLVQRLYVTRWDRFSRNAPEAYAMITKLNKMGVAINAIEQPIDFNIPEQKMMLAFYLTAPEIENDRRALNTINGIRKNKRLGRWVSGATIGYKNMRDERNKPIIVPSEHAPKIVRSFELFATGNYRIEELRKKMNAEEGHKFTRDKFWRMLRNPIYYGYIKIEAFREEPEELSKGIHEPLISEDLFNEVQMVIDGRKKHQHKVTKVREEYPLRGLLVCKQCSDNLTASASRGECGVRYPYYHCKNGCKERVSTTFLHSSFTDWLDSISLKPEVGQLYLSIMQDVFKSNEADRTAEVSRLEASIRKNQETLDKATMKLANDDMDRDDHKTLKANLSIENARLKARISELKSMESGFMEYMRYGMTLLGNLSHYYMNADAECKQKMISSVFPEKLVFLEKTFRTAEPSELLDLLYYENGENKKRKATSFGDLSCQVDGASHLSNSFIHELARLKEFKDKQIL